MRDTTIGLVFAVLLYVFTVGGIQQGKPAEVRKAVQCAAMTAGKDSRQCKRFVILPKDHKGNAPVLCWQHARMAQTKGKK